MLPVVDSSQSKYDGIYQCNGPIDVVPTTVRLGQPSPASIWTALKHRVRRISDARTCLVGSINLRRRCLVCDCASQFSHACRHCKLSSFLPPRADVRCRPHHAVAVLPRELSVLKCMLNKCLQWFKVSLQTLTAANSCLTLFHDCTNVVNHTLPVKRDVKRPSRFTGNV